MDPLTLKAKLLKFKESKEANDLKQKLLKFKEKIVSEGFDKSKIHFSPNLKEVEIVMPIKKHFLFALEHNGGGGLSKYNADLLSNIKVKEVDVFSNCKKDIPNVKKFGNNYLNHLKMLSGKYESGIFHINIFPDIYSYNTDKFETVFNELYQLKNIDIYITIHDYFWLYPNNPNILIRDMYIPSEKHLNVITKFFDYSKLIIFPTQQVKNIYEQYGVKFKDNYKIIPHIDLENKNIEPYYQKVDDEIRILFLGGFCETKGSERFKRLAEKCSKFEKFYVLGSSEKNCKNIKFLGSYNNDEVFKHINELKPHLIVLMSESYETYSYSTTIALNTGLPIYYNEAVYSERMNERLGSYGYKDLEGFENVLSEYTASL